MTNVNSVLHLKQIIKQFHEEEQRIKVSRVLHLLANFQTLPTVVFYRVLSNQTLGSLQYCRLLRNCHYLTHLSDILFGFSLSANLLCFIWLMTTEHPSSTFGSALTPLANEVSWPAIIYFSGQSEN